MFTTNHILSLTDCMVAWVVQASGEKKIRLLHKLANGKHSPDGLPPVYHAIRLEPDADDPAIGYKSMPAKSWWVH